MISVFSQTAEEDSIIQPKASQPFSVQAFLERLENTEFDQKTIDELIHVAKEHAFSKNYDVARELCGLILDYHPNYHDARLIIARTYAWDRDFEKARLKVGEVLQQDSLYEPASYLLITIDFWEGELKEGIQHCNAYISTYPPNQDVYMLRIKMLLNLKENDKALKYLRAYQKMYPEDNDAKKMIKELREGYWPNRANLFYTLNQFEYTVVESGIVELYNRHMISAEWENRYYMGTLIARLNHATFRGFARQQAELDWYPEFKNGDYAYLNFGLSSGRIFPGLRTGFEYYHGFYKIMEGSLGFRNLNFKGNSVMILTGSLGAYVGSFYLAMRPYIIPKGDVYGRTLDFTIRRYFQNADNFVGVNYGFGKSPDDIYWYIDPEVGNNAIYLENPSEKFSVNFRKNITQRWLVKLDYQLERQKLYSAAVQKDLIITTFMGGLSYAF